MPGYLCSSTPSALWILALLSMLLCVEWLSIARRFACYSLLADVYLLLGRDSTMDGELKIWEMFA